MKSKITIPSRIDKISTVYDWLESLIEPKIERELVQTILLVSQEITTNAVLHGNGLREEKFVTVEADILPERVILRVQDEGEGLKQLPTKREARRLNYLEESGRGLKLAVLMSDEVAIEGNIVIVTFNIK
jgi:anti-sigma regulatory factor (Ser/Thr protein kinase)